MIGLRVGLAAGVMASLRVGIGADEIAPQGPGMTGVSRDATSGVYVPTSSSEWSTALASAGLVSGGPSSLYLCQEASGNAADSIGAIAMTAAGSPLYQQAVTGWTRKAFGFNGGASQKFSVAAGTGPNPSSTSVAYLLYANVTATPASIMGLAAIASAAAPVAVQVNTTPRLRTMNPGTATTAGASNPTATGLQPMLLKYDRTNSTLVLYTGQEKIVGTYTSGAVDSAKGLGGLASGGAGGSAFTGQVAYWAVFSGAAAELSDANAKALLQTLGWTIPWS